MILFGDKSVNASFFNEKEASAVYLGKNVVWERPSTDNLFINTYTTKLFLNVSGKESVSVNGDRYMACNIDVEPGTKYRFVWEDATPGTDKNYPNIMVCFFGAMNTFVAPRLIYMPESGGAGKYNIVVPEGSVRMDVRIEDEASVRRQHFTGFKMFEIY